MQVPRWQDLVDTLLESKLPSSLKELRIFNGHFMNTKAEILDSIDRIKLELFARRLPKLKYASLSLNGLDWNTYGIIP
jgi:hypothetical protein